MSKSNFFRRWFRLGGNRHGMSAHDMLLRGTSARLQVERLEDRVVMSADTLGPLASNLLVTTPTHVRPTLTALISDTTTGHSRVVAAEYFIDSPGPDGTGIALS